MYILPQEKSYSKCYDNLLHHYLQGILQIKSPSAKIRGFFKTLILSWKIMCHWYMEALKETKIPNNIKCWEIFAHSPGPIM